MILPLHVTRCAGSECRDGAHCLRHIAWLESSLVHVGLAPVADYSDGLNGVGSRQ